MLRTFIKFTDVEYCDTRECPVETPCFNQTPQIETALPAIEGDLFKFIIDKSQGNYWAAQHLAVGITDVCGNFIQDVGTIEESDSQYYVTTTIPNLTGIHRFALYYNVQIDLIEFTPESSEGACDAIATFEIPTAPTALFEWSLDDVTYQESSTFTGLCQDGEITVYVRVVGEECFAGSEPFDLAPINCLDYKGWTLQQFQDAGIRLFQMYNCLLEDIQP